MTATGENRWPPLGRNRWPLTDARANGRRRRLLSAEEKLQIWLQLLTGELSQRQAAEQWQVDPTTIMRLRRIGREGALEASAQSKPCRRRQRGGPGAGGGARRDRAVGGDGQE